jgi:hypothetical protein
MRRTLLRLAIILLLLASWLTGSSLNVAQSQAQNQNPIYLVVAPELFTEELAGFVLLQQTRGFEVRTVWLSQPCPPPAAIKAEIQSHNPLPKYVLLVGDDEWIPTWPVSPPLPDSGRTDLFYTTFDGPSDFIPNTILGRLPVHNEQQLVAYLTKLAAYYQNEWYPDWMKQISFLATDDVTIVDSVEAKFEDVISTFTKPNGYTGTFTGHEGSAELTEGGDRLFPLTYHATIEDVKNVVNEGRAALIYAGKGSPTKFIWNISPGLNAAEVLQFDGPALPFVAAFASWTADYSVAISMADAWILNPTSGALTYIGATEDTYDPTNLKLADGVFRGLFSSYSRPLSIGEAFQTGLQFVKSVPSYYQIYQLFGDPSLTIRFPEGPLVTAPFPHILTNMGSTLTIPFTIKNVGPTEATFAIEASTDWESPLTLDPAVSPITLASGESTVIWVSVNIQAPYYVRARDVIRFTASQTNPLNNLLTENLSVSFQIFEPSVFLPLINR